MQELTWWQTQLSRIWEFRDQKAGLILVSQDQAQIHALVGPAIEAIPQHFWQTGVSRTKQMAHSEASLAGTAARTRTSSAYTPPIA
jgi:hypothetical protein